MIMKTNGIALLLVFTILRIWLETAGQLVVSDLIVFVTSLSLVAHIIACRMEAGTHLFFFPQRGEGKILESYLTINLTCKSVHWKAGYEALVQGC